MAPVDATAGGSLSFVATRDNRASHAKNFRPYSSFFSSIIGVLVVSWQPQVNYLFGYVLHIFTVLPLGVLEDRDPSDWRLVSEYGDEWEFFGLEASA